MFFVRGHSHLQGPARALEHGLQNVVGVLPGHLPDVEGHGARPDEGQEELLAQLRIEVPHPLGGQIHGPAQIVPAGKVAGHQHQRLVHGQEELAVTGDAPLVPQGLRKGPAQADADVLHAVVAVHLGVPLAAADQVKIRARRLGLETAPVNLASATDVKDIVTTLEKTRAAVVVIDSIQTMYLEEAESTPGSVAQVRACAYELIKLAKKKGFVLFLVGHVTKQGSIAGPRVLEHMVDTVLYFEGERGHHFRILRAVKNRYGATDEIGVFEMQDKGLAEVENPSALFLAERQGNISGSCVFAGIEGSRPVLVEIQALVSQSGYSSHKRAVVGWDSGRLSMVLAVLEARGGLNLSSQDVYLNIAGGLKISEPAADLAVAMAIVSSLTNHPLPADMVIFGEIGLSGEIRAVSQPNLRLKEAHKLGFRSAIVPSQYSKDKKKSNLDINIHEIGNVQKLINWFN